MTRKLSRPINYVVFLLIAGLAISLSLPRSAMSDTDKSEKQLRHVVMFKFKDDSSEADVQKVVDAFRQLPSQIPQIASFEFGTNNSPEGLADGFTHCFLVTFKSEADREVYLPHPKHKAFVDVLKPHLAKVLVVDYWASH